MKHRLLIIFLLGLFLGSTSVSAQSEDAQSRKLFPTRAQLADQPHNVFKVSVGPAMMFSKMYVGVPAETYNHRWGFDVTGDLQHIWSKGWGFGLNYAFNHTSFGPEGFSLHYVGPSAVYARRLVGGLGFDVSLGLGYGRFVEETHYIKYRSALARDGFGSMVQVGLEYLITESLGVGAEANLLSVVCKEDDMQLSDDESFGVRRFNLLLGLRIYF